MLNCWQERHDYLLQCFDLEKFQKEAKNLEDTLTSFEKELGNLAAPKSTEELEVMVRILGSLA